MQDYISGEIDESPSSLEEVVAKIEETIKYKKVDTSAVDKDIQSLVESFSDEWSPISRTSHTSESQEQDVEKMLKSLREKHATISQQLTICSQAYVDCKIKSLDTTEISETVDKLHAEKVKLGDEIESYEAIAVIMESERMANPWRRVTWTDDPADNIPDVPDIPGSGTPEKRTFEKHICFDEPEDVIDLGEVEDWVHADSAFGEKKESNKIAIDSDDDENFDKYNDAEWARVFAAEENGEKYL